MMSQLKRQAANQIGKNHKTFNQNKTLTMIAGNGRVLKAKMFIMWLYLLKQVMITSQEMAVL